MVEPCETRNNGAAYQMVRYQNHHNSRIPSSSTALLSSPLLELRVFYVRISNFKVDESTPEILTITHIPLDPVTLVEINGVRTSIVSSQLRRDRVGKNSESATYISTDSIRLSGSVKFEVYDRDDLVLSGTLEMSGGGSNSVKQPGNELRNMLVVRSCLLLPSVEVYVTGCFSGTPIILTKTLQLGFRKKKSRRTGLDSIAEYEAGEPWKDFEVTEYGSYKEGYDDMYLGREYEDGEMSWFNAGVRVGVGIGLGVCVGLGVGVGLLVRTYQSTTRNFRRRLL
ncbi:hypothetical protein Bca52824_024891 [Brassica carinata]|uniref:Erythronate-4-phosphate dehydrogenase family protein n=1 Tax=Brassica carinata TaxID=52824 RepID=A0A8X7VKV7_BRACI|nr:hypothetical protein Bca52824_024891 [Brassica carinata]